MKLSQHFLKIFFILALAHSAISSGQTKEIAMLQKKLRMVKDSADYVNRLNRIGMLMHLKSPDSCIFYGTHAKQIASRIGYKKGATDADNVIGIALALKGMNSEALKVFGRVLASYHDMGDIANEAQVYMNFASTSMQLGKEADAIKYSRLALCKGATIPNDSIMGKVYANYCIANPRLAEDSVMYYLSRSNAIGHSLNDQQLLIGNQQVLALFYLMNGKREKSLPLLLTAFEDAKKAELERLQIISLNLLAEYHSQDNPKLSLSLSEKQYALADANGYDDLKAEVLFGMQRFAQMAGLSKKEQEINRKLVAVLLEREQRMGKFIGDYVNYGKLQFDYDDLEKSEKFSRQATIVLSLASIAGIILSLMLLRAHMTTRKESRKKTILNAVIEEQNNKLRNADKFKSRLVSILAHDFRSPLISTLSLIKLLEEEESLDEADKAVFYKTLQEHISGLLGQFDTTLQWIRQQLRGETISREPLGLKDLFSECTDALAVMLAEKGVTVVNTIGEDISVHADKELLQFVNRNLLSNALKFSPEKENITVDARLEGSNVVVSVIDSGAGFPEGKIDQLFTISDAGGSTERGAGIALSMSKDFVESLGGSIWVKRDKASGTTTFSYSLPVA